MQQPPPYYPAPPKPSKTNTGCIVALAMVGGLVILGGAIMAFAAWKFSTSKTGSTIIALAGEGAKVMIDAQSAPGTAELRAMGCRSAGVIDIARFDAIARKHLDAGLPPARAFALAVGCTVDPGDPLPTCDALARAYVAAVRKPAGRFAVSVRDTGASTCACTSLYEPSGAKVHSLPSSSVPRFP